MLRSIQRRFVATTLCVLVSAPATALEIVYDYRFDRHGFFDPATAAGAARRAVLAAAADPYSSFSDALSAIAPSRDNHWRVSFRHPSFSSFFEIASVDDLAVPADTLTIFVGASSSQGPVLGAASIGEVEVFGDASFAQIMTLRGQDGAGAALPTDYGPWGGSLWLNSRIDWYVGLDASGLGSAQADLLTTVTHELAHLLGVGEAPSWHALATGSAGAYAFDGAASSALYGAPVPLDPIAAHWAEGVMSDVDGTIQETLMDPTTARGTREYLTRLDLAGLADVGWQTTPIPEPSTLLGCAAGLIGLALLARRGRVLSLRRGTALG
jgi:hypothetical protein